MIVQFNTAKVVQAAGVLLKEHAGRMSRLRLLKLLYIADREFIQETLRPITGDRVAAMDHGPVLSQTYDLLRGKGYGWQIWEEHVVPEGPQDHRLVKDPGNGKLSKREIEKLRSVSEEHREMNDYSIAIETHGFEEWVKNKPQDGSSKIIPLDDILCALDLGQQKCRIEMESRASEAMDRELAIATKEVGLRAGSGK